MTGEPEQAVRSPSWRRAPAVGEGGAPDETGRDRGRGRAVAGARPRAAAEDGLGLSIVLVYYALCLFPAAAGVALDPSRALWLASAAGAPAAVVWLYQRGGRARAAALVLNAASALGNSLLLFSVYLQGQGLNAQFFHHVDWPTLLVGWEAFGRLVATAFAYCVAVGLWPRLLPQAVRGPRPRARTVGAVLGLGFLLNAAVVSLLLNAASEIVAASRIVLVPKPLAPVAPAGIANPRDLVLIVAESLEATLGREDVVGADLTPRLTRLAAEGLEFADMRQVSHTGWTTGALVASSCAVPMDPRIRWSWMRPDRGADVPGGRCLGDVLAAAGYRTVFMVGHDLAFGGVGDFYAAHGFAERLGRAALGEAVGDAGYRSPWGVYDDSLLAAARARLRELAAGDVPYALVVLTMDTHFPPGHPSRSCGPAPADAGRAFVVRCADRLLSEFVADVRADHPDAVVVLHSDHLLPTGLSGAPGSGVGALPRFHDDPGLVGMFARGRDHGVRRLRFAIWDARRAPRRIQRPGTHFDIMPTVLDVLGFESWIEHGFGGSLLRAESPWLAHPEPDRLQFVRRIPDLALAPGDAVVFSADGPVVEIGGTRLLATGRGLRLGGAVFAVGFDGEGRASGILDAAGLDDVRGGGTTLVVGVSGDADFNATLPGAEDAAVAFFAGRLDTPALAAGPLRAGVAATVSVP